MNIMPKRKLNRNKANSDDGSRENNNKKIHYNDYVDSGGSSSCEIPLSGNSSSFLSLSMNLSNNEPSMISQKLHGITIQGQDEEAASGSFHRLIDSFIQSHDAPSDITACNATRNIATPEGNSFMYQSNTLSPTVNVTSVVDAATSVSSVFYPPIPSMGWSSHHAPTLTFDAQSGSIHSQLNQAGLHDNLYHASNDTATGAIVQFSTQPQIPNVIPSAGLFQVNAIAMTTTPTHQSFPLVPTPSTTTSTSTCCISVASWQDSQTLSAYQTLLREQLEFFAATSEDASIVQGRNKPIKLNQVGIRCRHCANQNVAPRTTGSTYYPTRLDSIYQSGQNVAKYHYEANRCRSIPPDIQQTLSELAHEVKGKKSKSAKGGGKLHWAHTARELGIIEYKGRLEFATTR